MADQAAAGVETHAFEAEVSRLLHLMVHAVYSNKDIFLRELISNAADACEKLRYRAIAEPALLGGEPELNIRIEADATKGTLTVSDNGIGMSREELKGNLGTIARSGTRAFLDTLANAADKNRLIGQFGVGFYSAFMVAREVEVFSRRAGAEEAHAWISDGSGTFALRPATAEEAPTRGTRVVLHLLDDARSYAEPATIERIVAAYSAHVPVPIEFRRAQEAAWRRLGEGAALWTRPRTAVTEAEYREFYGTVAGQYGAPALTIHYRAEGRHEYSVLLFVPEEPPFDLFDPGRRGRVKLYVRRVFITDEADLLPPWLRFVRGVIDSEDLPLNLSREMLQANPVLEAIRKGVAGRVVSELAKLASSDEALFTKVWEAFGSVIKEGLYEAPERRDELFKLVRFRSSKGGEGWRTLADYVKDLRPNQTAIYYILGDSREAVAASPHLEGFAARGVEVLFLTDPVDAFWVRTAIGYEGKPFQSVTQGAADLDLIPNAGGEAEADATARAADIATLAARFRQALGEAVSEVRASARLAASPVCLVAPDFGPDRQLEKLLARAEGAKAGLAPVLELNPRHALIKALAGRVAGGGPELDDAAWLLYGQARVLDGEALADPKAFVERLTRLMEKSLG